MAGKAVAGVYAGNGINGRQITGLGFSPKAVASLILDFSFGQFFFRTSAMTGNGMSSAGVTNAFQIQSIDADGFTVGATAGLSANAVGLNYHWIAWDDPLGEDFASGVYTGDGTNPRSIPCGFTPDAVWCGRKDIGLYSWRSSHSNPAAAFRWFNGGPWAGLAIVGNGATSFTVDTNLNANGIEYHWCAWRQSAEFCAVGSYTGNNTDNRAINHSALVQFSPTWVILDAEQITSGSSCAMHMNSLSTGDSSITMRTGFSGQFGDIVQQNLPTGFEVGTQAFANFLNERYNYTSYGAGIFIPPPITELPEILGGGAGAMIPFAPYQRYKALRALGQELNNVVLGP